MIVRADIATVVLVEVCHAVVQVHWSAQFVLNVELYAAYIRIWDRDVREGRAVGGVGGVVTPLRCAGACEVARLEVLVDTVARDVAEAARVGLLDCV